MTFNIRVAVWHKDDDGRENLTSTRFNHQSFVKALIDTTAFLCEEKIRDITKVEIKLVEA